MANTLNQALGTVHINLLLPLISNVQVRTTMKSEKWHSRIHAMS